MSSARSESRCHGQAVQNHNTESYVSLLKTVSNKVQDPRGPMSKSLDFCCGNSAATEMALVYQGKFEIGEAGAFNRKELSMFLEPIFHAEGWVCNCFNFLI